MMSAWTASPATGETLYAKISVLPTYRNAVPTQSILIHLERRVRAKTGNTPDGRRAGTPFARGEPDAGRDRKER